MPGVPFEEMFNWVEKTNLAQWISLLYRRVQKIDEIQPDHCDIYQKNHNKKCN